MFWSIAPLVIACIVLAGMLGMCSFAPNGPGKGPAPSYDAPAALQADADALKIPIRLPKLPDGWQANSGSRKGIDGGRTDPATGLPSRAVSSTVGYLAPSGMYISLTQSNADEDKLVASINTDLLPDGDAGCRRREMGGVRGDRPERQGGGAGVDHPTQRGGRARRRSRSQAPQVRRSTVRWRRRRRPSRR